MTALVWFLSELGFPVALVASFALAVDVARHGPVRVRHYRWRNRRFLRTVREIELRSRAGVRGGFGEEAGSASPAELPALAGGDARPPTPVDAALPPAPSALAGAGCPRPSAPARPHPVRLGGAW